MHLALTKIAGSTTLVLLSGLAIFQGLLWLGDRVDRELGLTYALVVYAGLLPTMLLWAVVVAKKFNGLTPRQCGFGGHAIWGFPAGILLGLVTILGFIQLTHGAETSLSDKLLAALNDFKTLGFLITVISSTEEFLFRGLVFLWLLKRCQNLAVAVLVSALVFSATHGVVEDNGWVWLLALFSLGVIFALAYERFGSCWLAAGLHTGFNLSTELHRRTVDQLDSSAAMAQLQTHLALALVLLAAATFWWTMTRGKPGKLTQQIRISSESALSSPR